MGLRAHVLKHIVPSDRNASNSNLIIGIFSLEKSRVLSGKSKTPREKWRVFWENPRISVELASGAEGNTLNDARKAAAYDFIISFFK